MNDDIEIYIKSQTKRLLIAWGVILLANIVLTTFDLFIVDPHSSAEDLAGERVSGIELMKSLYFSLIFGIPFLSFFIGALINFIPFKNLEYRKKFNLSVLAIIVLFQSAFFILEMKSLLRI